MPTKVMLPQLKNPGMDPLPQPYRMLDKILAGIIENGLRIADLREKERELASSCRAAQVRHSP